MFRCWDMCTLGMTRCTKSSVFLTLFKQRYPEFVTILPTEGLFMSILYCQKASRIIENLYHKLLNMSLVPLEMLIKQTIWYSEASLSLNIAWRWILALIDIIIIISLWWLVWSHFHTRPLEVWKFRFQTTYLATTKTLRFDKPDFKQVILQKK